MPNETAFSGLLAGFVLTLTRVGSLFAFIPFPGTRTYMDAPKAILSVAVSVMLFRFWIVPDSVTQTALRFVMAVGAEATLGIAIGTGLAMILEAMQLWAQFIALQAGFSYATTIDPNSEADSGVLLIFAQLLTSLLIFTIGLDRQMLLALSQSCERIPLGSFHLTGTAAMGIVQLGSQMFQVGFRLSLPVIAILLVADVALALVGKIEQHMQLSGLMFPMKTLVAIWILAIGMTSSGRLIERWLEEGWRTVRGAAGF